MPKPSINIKTSRKPHTTTIFPMARLLLPVHRITSLPQASFAIGTVFLCAFALLMCAGHSRKWRNHLRACYSYSYEEPVIHINNHQGMMQGFQFENDDGSGYGGEESVWQRNILMGGKCQLPDFSGVIIYDSEGNIVPRGKPTLALPWK